LETIDDAVFNALPDLRVISKYGVGIDTLDLPAFVKRGIHLGWTGGVNKRSVAELVIAFAISMLRHVPRASAEVRTGKWQQIKGRQISGKTFGIVGCGRVGKDLVPLLRAFGCRIVAHDIRDYTEFYAANGVEALPLDTLLAESDVVTLHLPFDASTDKILNDSRLAMIKSDAVLINAARGGLVDEGAMKAMLMDGRLFAAAFDVFAGEPPTDMELLNLPNFFATPHIGGSSEEAILNMGRAAIRGLSENKIPDAEGAFQNDPNW
jgi:phosphoglycerate dehydrogenase-like enzyme